MKNAYRISIATAVAMLGLAAGTPALADDSRTARTASEARPISGKPTPALAKPDPNQRFCIRATPTGSHIQRTFCETRAQWANKGTVIVER